MSYLGQHVIRVMNEYTNYNYKTGTHTYFIQTVSLLLLKDV